jgi:hypothetical protein
MSYQALLRALVAMVASAGFLVAAAQAQQVDENQACPHEIGWKPKPEELRLILSDHLQWSVSRQDPHRRANLCNANLIDADLYGANLSYANLNKANLSHAILNGAILNGVDLRTATLRGTYLDHAELIGANLSGTNLSGNNLSRAELIGANLSEANLHHADLHNAQLGGANLNGADLRAADLGEADLTGAQLKDTQLAYTNIEKAVYAPASPPPNPYVVSIIGLETVTFPIGQEVGLVQLRELLQKAGLREEERQVTYAIESGKTKHALDAWYYRQGDAAEGLFKLILFDWTTAYGLYPSQALVLLAELWALSILLVYWGVIRFPTGPAGIYRVWPKDRIEVDKGNPALCSEAKVERLCAGDLAASVLAAWFSLLSAFHLGFREFSVGTWLSRVQPRQFTLEATGWVRVWSGVQSLISLYLLAMWVLTYFGRPFQ